MAGAITAPSAPLSEPMGRAGNMGRAGITERCSAAQVSYLAKAAGQRQTTPPSNGASPDCADHGGGSGNPDLAAAQQAPARPLDPAARRGCFPQACGCRIRSGRNADAEWGAEQTCAANLPDRREPAGASGPMPGLNSALRFNPKATLRLA